MTPAGGGATVRTEREAKLRAPAGFSLPDLGELLPGVFAKALPELDLDAVYYDTTDLRLARFGITVRHRAGEDGPCWTVKFPDSAARGPALVRSEIEIPAPRDPLPARVADLVLAYTRSRPLVPVAALRTDLILERGGDDLANMLTIRGCDSIELDRRIVCRQNHAEVAANPRIVDVSELVSSEYHGPVLGIDSDPVDLARLVGGDDELIVADVRIAAPARKRLVGIVFCGREIGARGVEELKLIA